MATAPKHISEHSRRHFLGLTAATGVTAAAATLLPRSVVHALAQPRPAGSLDDIRHVVILMQENRSFDHYFGSLRGVRGYADNSALPGVFEQRGIHPYRVRDAANRGDLSIEYIASLPHGWDDGHQALNGGRMDGWIQAKGTGTMAGYDRADIPFQYALADTFTVCDGYFCSSPTSTSPNRNYLFSGHSGEEPAGGRATGNDAYDTDHPGYTWSTYAEHLQDAGVTWQVYQEWDNYTDNNLDFFRRFRDIGRQALVDAGESDGSDDLTSFFESLTATEDDPSANIAPVTEEFRRRARAVHEAARRRGGVEAELYQRALYRNEPGSLVRRFAEDVTRGTLPAVSWIVPPSQDSEHPSVSSPVRSSHLVYDLLDTLAAHEEVWRHTVVFLMFDEFDGYFDHVVPPLPPRDEPGEWFDGKPMGLGFRVPMTVVSPWSAGGAVSSEVFDHTSVLRFLERVTGVTTPKISAWRRSICGDLVATLDFSSSEGLRVPTRPAPAPAFDERWKPEPGGDEPIQEYGDARALPTPYRLDASVIDGRLELINDGTRAAVFGIYPSLGTTARGLRSCPPQHVTVSGRTSVSLPLGCGHVVVTGPDRFLRDLSFLPGGSTPQVFLDHDAATVTAAGARPRVSAHWYELSIPSVHGRCYYTGRLETGSATRTSPFRRA